MTILASVIVAQLAILAIGCIVATAIEIRAAWRRHREWMAYRRARRAFNRQWAAMVAEHDRNRAEARARLRSIMFAGRV